MRPIATASVPAPHRMNFGPSQRLSCSLNLFCAISWVVAILWGLSRPGTALFQAGEKVSEDEVRAFLPPAEHRDRGGGVAHACVATLADSTGTKLFPLEGAVGPVVLLQHSGKRPACLPQLGVVARVDAGGEIVGVDLETEAYEFLIRSHGHRDQNGHEELSRRKRDLLLFPVPIDTHTQLRGHPAKDNGRGDFGMIGIFVARDPSALEKHFYARRSGAL